MEKTDSLLGPLLRRLGIEDGVRLARIQASWDGIFDRPLSQHISPARFAEGELLINVESPPWLQQLSYCKRDIVDKLRPFGVREVRFRVGRIYRKSGQTGPPAEKTLAPEDREFIAELVAGVPDEDLRAAVRAAAERSLSKTPPRPTRPASRR